MDKQRIEQVAFELHRKIWEHRRELWPSQELHPIQMLDPELACPLIGADFEKHVDLGSFGHNGSKFKIAGHINRQLNKIAVCSEYAPETVRFTIAHEVGHWLLHPEETLHRDRPLNYHHNQKTSRPLKEREADYFAACFLMPKRLLEAQFKYLFMTDLQFHFTDQAAFFLNPSDPEILLRPEKDSLEREFALARAESYGHGRRFNSLAKQFNVSNQAMAIRIQELNLIKWP